MNESMSQLARRMNVSRNQIWTWHHRRDRNGFPESVGYGSTRDERGVSTKVQLFDVDAVLEWRASYVPNKGGNPNLIAKRKTLC